MKVKYFEKLKEKIEMYDMIIANFIAGNDIIEPAQKLGASEIEIMFNSVASETEISRWFCISKFPDYMKNQLYKSIREECVTDDVKINFYVYCSPYKIDWNSAEMKNKMTLWKRYTAKQMGDGTVFDYRENRQAGLNQQRIIKSTKYLNEAELDYDRTTVRTAFMIKVTGQRTDMGLVNLSEAIRNLKLFCNDKGIVLRDVRVNVADWIRSINMFSLRNQKEVTNHMSYKVITDDVLANMNSYTQGRVGYGGLCLALDVQTMSPIMKIFKENPDDPENVLISAETGGGKSYFLKPLISYFLADGCVVIINDYEGDEYTNYASYLKAANPDDVCVISMGKGSTEYFDPCEIPALTGDPEVDDALKETAESYILAMFRVMVHGVDDYFTTEEEVVMSKAISRMYDCNGVTDDKYTWEYSKGLTLRNVYEEIEDMVISKELQKEDDENKSHIAAVNIRKACSIFFDEGGSKSGTFKKPIPASKLFGAKMIVFSFGMKGAGNEGADPALLALKQLSVANVSIQISNHSKYVKHTFTVKAWEEFQRWGEAKGSADIIGNAMTGGRKRGDINLIITNDLSSMLDDDNPLNSKLRQNIQHYFIGKIADRQIREKFCEKFDLQECLPALDRIAKATQTGGKKRKKSKKGGVGFESKYKHAFLIALGDGQRAVGKVFLPPELRESNIFRTGVVIGGTEEQQ